MPQAPEKLRKAFSTHREALDAIEHNFRVSQNGVIYRRNHHLPPFTDHEYAAIDYLMQEWDHDYSPT